MWSESLLPKTYPTIASNGFFRRTLLARKPVRARSIQVVFKTDQQVSKDPEMARSRSKTGGAEYDFRRVSKGKYQKPSTVKGSTTEASTLKN